jgi:SAM-dependent methyltransferase
MRMCLSCAATFEATGWSCPRCGYAPELVDGLPLFAPDLARGNPEDAAYGYDALYAAESRHFWFVNRSRLIAWAIARYFPGVRSLFDAGCGTGGVLRALRAALPHLRLSAGDAHVSGLAFARRQLPDVSFVQLDVRQMPFDGEFDLVGLFDVLEHLDDEMHVLREIHRATRPGGGLIVTVPQHRWLWSALDEYSHHRRRYSRGDLLTKIRRAGFTIDRVTSFMALTLPAQLAARLRKRRLATLDPGAELALGPAVNGVLGAICAVERTAIGAGLSLPVGGSLMVVARRSRQ